MQNSNRTHILSSDKDFNKFQENRKYSFYFYQYAENLFDKYLQTGEYQKLFQLFTYFEHPQEYPRLERSAETLRMHVMLKMLQLEFKHNKIPYISSADSFSALMTQWYHTTFSLRRIEMNFQGPLLADAVNYLYSIPFNIYAAQLFLHQEYFENYDRLYSALLNYFSEIWSLNDRMLFCLMWEQESLSDAMYLNKASLFMEQNDLLSAYATLNKIKNPTTEIINLNSSLKEILSNESK